MDRPRGRMRLASALSAALALLACAGAWARYPAGESDAAVAIDGTEIRLFVYKPHAAEPAGLIVSLHGAGRNAEAYRRHTRPLADRFDAMLVVPLFDQERFPGWRYQRAGIVRRDADSGALAVQPRPQWTAELLRGIVEAVRAHEGAPDLPLVLIGHSAGAQLLLRATALAPVPAQRIVVANPSSWLVPSRTEPFPFGFGGLPDALADEDALRRYLAQPLTVFLGQADTGSAQLSNAAGARRQGEHRLARGRHVFQLAAEAARVRGWAFGWQLVEVPAVGHSARAMYASGLAERALCPEGAEERRGARAAVTWPCTHR